MKVQSLPYGDGHQYFDCLRHLPGVVWLDSGRAAGEHARYDILSALPSRTLSGPDLEAARAEINRSLSALPQIDCELPFCGGWIGYLSYQARHKAFKLPPRRDYRCPDLWFGWYDWALVRDRLRREAYLVITEHCSQAVQAEIQKALASSPRPAEFSCGVFVPGIDKARYLADLQRVQDYILAGDCYQVNYTQRFSADFSGDPAAAYLTLREAVPSPFSAFLRLPGGEAILSISPERFVRVNGRTALTQPIKGTAPKVPDAAEDERQRKTLLESEKNRAENLMIVDLLRNDFNQSCLPHSVRVDKLFELQSFANVHHLVSSITGTLPEGLSHLDFLLPCFPGGSITGAPKKRAMEVIEELEAFGRGVYCGSIGYMSTSGQSDFNIAIRTFYVEGDRIHCWAGGGIVADSEPESEYQEAHHKIAALIRAISDLTGW